MADYSKLSARIDAAVLAAVAPKVSGARLKKQTAIIAAFGLLLPTLLAAAEINTPLRISHFISQVAHESDGFCAIEEYASGAAYEGRKDLGNTQKGDGIRFKGRGPIQLTGRANYRDFTIWMRKRRPDCPDFEANPELVATWPWAGWAAAYFWAEKDLNALADRDDLVAVTKRINGGRNGIDERGAYLKKAKAEIMPLASIDYLTTGYVVLRRGHKSAAVDRLQRALVKFGMPIGIDGDFGPATELAVKALQKARGVTPADGIVGKNTWVALEAYLDAA